MKPLLHLSYKLEMSLLPRVSESEWEIMEVLWGRKSVTVLEVVQQVKARRSWKEQTIRTMLTRLEKKGAVVCEEGSRPIRYSACVTRESLIRKSKHGFLWRVMEEMNAPVLVELIRRTKMSESEIDGLKQILNEKKGN